MQFGVHTPLQDTPIDELTTLWQRIERAGAGDDVAAFDWISVWDHLGSLAGTSDNLDGVAMHAALACHTRRVRCACLVYSVGYRHALVLANAVATIDHLSGGRAVLGIGAGYLAHEYVALGGSLPPPGARTAHLAEAARAIRSLLDGDEVTLLGRYVQLQRARCAPSPLQPHLPMYVGGGGERATIPLAAAVADGWNVPMASPDDAARKIALLRECEGAAGRPAGTVDASISIGLCFDETRLADRFGSRWETLRPAIATGSTQQVVDLVGRYAAAGADRLVLSVRAPFDERVSENVERFAAEVIPTFAVPSGSR